MLKISSHVFPCATRFHRVSSASHRHTDSGQLALRSNAKPTRWYFGDDDADVSGSSDPRHHKQNLRSSFLLVHWIQPRDVACYIPYACLLTFDPFTVHIPRDEELRESRAQCADCCSPRIHPSDVHDMHGHRYPRCIDA